MELAVCAGLTGLGLVLSWLVMRRRGAASGLRGAAWSLIPIAAYLTGVWEPVWNLVGNVIGGVLNPLVWAGVAVAGLSAVLFVVSGVMLGRRSGGTAPRAMTAKDGAGQIEATSGGQKAAPKAPKAPQGKDEDLSDIEDILKRRGIS